MKDLVVLRIIESDGTTWCTTLDRLAVELDEDLFLRVERLRVGETVEEYGGRAITRID